MKGYKGFAPGLVCRGKQYAENTVFEEEKAVICHSGMHFCENPLDVLDYYDLVRDDGTFNDFAEVEALADTKTDDNKKFCTTKLKVGAKLSFAGFVKACVDFIFEKTVKDIPDSNVDSGDYAQIGSSGYSAKIGSSGDSAKIGSSGDYAKIGSSGDSARIDSTGEDSVICCAGHASIVKAKKGSWITLSEWERDPVKNRWIPVCVKTEAKITHGANWQPQQITRPLRVVTRSPLMKIISPNYSGCPKIKSSGAQITSSADSVKIQAVGLFGTKTTPGILLIVNWRGLLFQLQSGNSNLGGTECFKKT